jgi:hypothetical protein
MAIERDKEIAFHKAGTLDSVTRWINSHDEGLAEWLKNVRRAYQSDRLDVPDEDRVVVVLLRDQDRGGTARIGVLDVGGATLEDLEKWRVWDDPEASSRGSGFVEETTQGNGGKAYMFRMFDGQARFLALAETVRNCIGFEGLVPSVERGTPGFMPSVSEGCQVSGAHWKTELERALIGYDMEFGELPVEVRRVLEKRQRFTLVEGEAPVNLFRGRVPLDLIDKVLRHDQSTLAVEQMKIFAFHNARPLNDCRPLTLEIIPPYPGLEGPFVFDIPSDLPDEDGVIQSTTIGNTKPTGRLTLYTSRRNMYMAHKQLRPRWKMSYRAGHQMLGAKSIAEIAPAAPGAEFIYGQIELVALAAYAELGRVRPKEGPLVSAVDLFTAEKIRELAKKINEQRRHELDASLLDDVHRENRLLDQFKNRFMPAVIFGENGRGAEADGGGRGGGQHERGTTPDSIELNWAEDAPLRVGRGVPVHLPTLLSPRVKDQDGKTVSGVKVEWITEDGGIARADSDGWLTGRRKGITILRAKVSGAAIYSQEIVVDIWLVDHVLLTPRSVELKVGGQQTVTAEVTNDEGHRATDVLLKWEHDADDPLVIRINQYGKVFGNRVGQTSVTAGAEGVDGEIVQARVRCDIEVKPNLEDQNPGNGFPRLLLTDRDTDPFTGEVRPGSPDQPALWQEVWDEQNNIWWLNLQSDDAAFAFEKRTNTPEFWRMFHAQQLVQMVVQVHMKHEFTEKGQDEKPEPWGNHKQATDIFEVTLKPAMWEDLRPYVNTGGGLE